jgi:hypothetical protein
MHDDLAAALQYSGLNDLPANPLGNFSTSYSSSGLASLGMPWPLRYGSPFSNDYSVEIAAKKRSPTLRCVMCGAPTAGTYYPYCPDCYKKSLDPKGGVPPIPIIIDPLKQME